MNVTRELDATSPVIQRVFRLRERLARGEEYPTAGVSRPGTPALPADLPPGEESYPWQMWQKSDFFAYGGDEQTHRCRAQTGAPLQGR